MVENTHVDRETLFFCVLMARHKFQLANCKNWKAKAPQASVCWFYGRNRADRLANLGLESIIDG